jgi:hypothetical protein
VLPPALQTTRRIERAVEQIGRVLRHRHFAHGPARKASTSAAELVVVLEQETVRGIRVDLQTRPGDEAGQQIGHRAKIPPGDLLLLVACVVGDGSALFPICAAFEPARAG